MLIIAAVLLAVLIPLLLRSISRSIHNRIKTNKQLTFFFVLNDNITLRWNTAGITVAGVSGLSGNLSNQLNRPWGLALTYDNILYVADPGNNRIQFFPPGQMEGRTIAGIVNKSGINATLFYEPVAIILDNQLNMYVADSTNHRIQKFLRY